VPEIVTHGKSGFICDSIDHMVTPIHHIDQLIPSVCRDEARRFTASAMTDRYLAVYDELIHELGSVTALPTPVCAFPPASRRA
jgi:hypothetical protein